MTARPEFSRAVVVAVEETGAGRRVPGAVREAARVLDWLARMRVPADRIACFTAPEVASAVSRPATGLVEFLTAELPATGGDALFVYWAGPSLQDGTQLCLPAAGRPEALDRDGLLAWLRTSTVRYPEQVVLLDTSDVTAEPGPAPTRVELGAGSPAPGRRQSVLHARGQLTRSLLELLESATAWPLPTPWLFQTLSSRIAESGDPGLGVLSYRDVDGQTLTVPRPPAPTTPEPAAGGPARVHRPGHREAATLLRAVPAFRQGRDGLTALVDELRSEFGGFLDGWTPEHSFRDCLDVTRALWEIEDGEQILAGICRALPHLFPPDARSVRALLAHLDGEGVS
ncbi:hypothetical protein Lfu02_41790 [Longispora fulva]|uniref:Uncharacterized protein n=1 Tax=Longispora fulva TaxID=619741 RepID=A0A8J7GA69_9ACTN|nr:hypothetical protein [Longispora fulva]MBG6136638.1 hypothetical protein [Longispora fulva]GIG59807.1 hypothetical protein Lfu02_41790 [Longispora fulva]